MTHENEMEQKTALIFGITGMDGSHLADLLLEKGYKVIGIKRRSSTNNNERIQHLLTQDNFEVMEADLTDYSSIISVLSSVSDMDEIFNLAAQSHVGVSFKQPGITWDITAKGCMNILQALVDLNMCHVRFYQASSSEMFGSSVDVKINNDNKVLNLNIADEEDKNFLIDNFNKNKDLKYYQDENTKFLPQSPYAIAKCAAHMSVRLYREAYGIHASCGILFNHEGPRRGENFVTRKITKWIGDFIAWQKETLPEYGKKVCRTWETEDYIHYCIDEETQQCVTYPKLRLGNLESKRDWGHAKDYVRAMHLMLQQDEPDDYVICTEEAHSIKEFLNISFNYALGEDYKKYVMIDPEFYRPAEVDFLLGNCSKAKKQLEWKKRYNFIDLVQEMTDYDIQRHDRL